MENITIKNHLLNGYNKLAYTSDYIMGYAYAGNIYYCYMDATTLDPIVCLDRASRGAGYSLRFKPTKAQKIYMLTQSEVLCSEKYFNDMVAEYGYNKGEIFEKLITELIAHQVWEKDNIPFTQAGDIEMDGIAYQIKFEKATFTNEKTLYKMMGA